MVYGFVLFGSVLVGAIYWISSICQEQGAMWSPGGGILKPEPWLQTNFGGFEGWESGETQYSDWAPGAYLNLFTSTTTTTTTVKRIETTKRIRKPITIPTRRPPATQAITSPSSSEVIEEIFVTSETSEDSDIPPSDTEPSFDENLRPPPQEDKGPMVSAPEKNKDDPPAYSFYDDYGRSKDPSFPPADWTARDQNEEAYEERPRDLTNTRPPDKLPVGGWGYEY